MWVVVLNFVNLTLRGASKPSGLVDSIGDMIRSPGNIIILCKSKKKTKHWVWTPPDNEQIKVNVDGSCLSGSGRGGIFRNSGEEVLIQFGNEMEIDSSIHAEVLALRKGILVVAASRWVSSNSFVFESNSQSIVAWVADPSSVLWRFQNIFWECCHVFGYNIEWSIRHITT